MLSVILVNWNGWADTLSCVQSLLNSGDIPFRIVIVDNMSSNCSIEAFERWSAGEFELIRKNNPIEKLSEAGATKTRRAAFFRYLESENLFEALESRLPGSPAVAADVYVVVSGRNGGFGFGCNVGMRLADQLGTDGYWLLNNDCVVNPQALAELAFAVHARPETAFGTVVRYYAPPNEVQAFGGGTLSRRTGKSTMFTSARPGAHLGLDYIYGASLAFSQRIRASVGDFDQKIFMYYEEMDFCIRIANAGFAFGVIETNVFHRHGGSQGGVSVAAWQNVLVNKWYVLRKHFGLGLWVPNFVAALLVRCVIPFGERNAMTGARQALKALIKKEVS